MKSVPATHVYACVGKIFERISTKFKSDSLQQGGTSGGGKINSSLYNSVLFDLLLTCMQTL